MISKKVYPIFIAGLIITGCGLFQKKSNDSNDTPNTPSPTATPQNPAAGDSKPQDPSNPGISNDPAKPQNQLTACQQQIAAWRSQNSTATPFQTINKLSQWKLSSSELQEIISGDPAVNFPEPLKADGQPYSSINVSTLSLGKEMDARGQKILGNLNDLVSKRPQKTLLIVHAGLAHVLDYYLTNINTDIAYAGYPLTATSKFETDELNQVFSAMGSPSTIYTGADQSVIMPMGAYARLYYHDTPGAGAKFSVADLLNSKVPNSSTIMISDFHGLRETALAATLPDAKCVTELGYDRIKVALETSKMSYGTGYSWDQTFAVFDFKSQLGQSRLNTIQSLYPSAYQILQSGNAQTNPNVIALIKKLKTYIDAGIAVDMTGLE